MKGDGYVCKMGRGGGVIWWMLRGEGKRMK